MRRVDFRFYGVVTCLVVVIFLVSRLFTSKTTDFRPAAKYKVKSTSLRKPSTCPEYNDDEIKHISRRHSVTVVVSLHPLDEGIVIQTINSIITHSDPKLLKEIIISNDGEIGDKHMMIIREEFAPYEPLVKVMTSPTDNKLKSKLLVGHAAKGDIVVFVDDTVTVSDGFLIPLIKALEDHKERIVSPQFAYISDVHLKESTEKIGSKWIFDWKMNAIPFEVSFQEMSSKAESDVFPTLAFDVSAFALHKTYLEKLIRMKHGGEFINSVDMSFSTWLCGDGAYVVPCSKIGLATFQKRPTLDNVRSMYNIAQRYMSERYLNVFKRVNKEPSSWTPRETQSIQIDKNFLKQCPRDFDWLMENIAKNDVYIPSDDAVAYGTFVSQTGITVFNQNSAMVFLGTALPNKQAYYQARGKTIEYLRTKQLRMGKECLIYSEKGYVVSDVCNFQSDDYKWEWTNLNQFKQRIGNEDKCISHATDPYPEEKNRQILMYTICADSSSENLKFQQWSSFNWLV